MRQRFCRSASRGGCFNGGGYSMLFCRAFDGERGLGIRLESCGELKLEGT